MKSKRKKALSECKVDVSLACKTALQSLRKTVAEQMEQIPMQKGIFVGNEDRTTACMAACRLLMASESRIEAFRKALAELASGECIGQCEKWQLFYEQTVTVFLTRFEAAADLLHDGEGCNPSLLISLCRDFCRSADLFLNHEADTGR